MTARGGSISRTMVGRSGPFTGPLVECHCRVRLPGARSLRVEVLRGIGASSRRPTHRDPP